MARILRGHASMADHLRARIGIIGCGGIVRLAHLPVLLQLRHVNVVALADSDAGRVATAAALVPGARSYTDYQQLLEREDVDAVIIALPTNLHADATSAALERRKHIYLEKPLASSLADATELLTAWRVAGTVGLMGFNYRFNPIFLRLRSRLQCGQLGAVVGVRTVFTTARRVMPEWKNVRMRGGGVLLDLASHHIDILRWLFAEEISGVAAELSSRHTEDDTAALQLTLASGIMVQSFFSLAATEEDKIEIYCENGKLSVDLYRSLDAEVEVLSVQSQRLSRLTRPLRTARRFPYLVKKFRSPNREPSYSTALASFIVATESCTDVQPDFLDGYRNAVVIDAAERAAAAHCTIPLNTDVQ